MHFLYDSNGLINVCTDFEINRYKLTNLENISGTFCNQPDASTTFGSKVMGQSVFDDLDLDP